MKLNKTLALAALVAGSLFAGNLALQAQDNTNTPPAGAPPGGGMRGRGMNFDMVAKQLALTDDQKPKVKAIIDDMQKQQRDLRADTSVAQEDKRAKAKEIREAATAQLKPILTSDQFEKWTKMGPGQRQRPQAAPPTGDAPATPPPASQN
jgi:Spy/CpxP family protein refolding chaperone